MSKLQRRQILIAAGWLFAAPLASFAQRSTTRPRIGFVGLNSPESSSLLNAFREGLRERGYIEGRNIEFTIRSTGEQRVSLPEFSSELVRLKVDVIVAFGSTSVEAASKATKTIPIVMVAVGDPVGSGYITSLARPGGNMTGISSIQPDLAAKRLELLREVLPKTSRVAVLVNPANPIHPVILREMRAAAPALRFTVQSFEARSATEIESGFASMARERPEVLVVLADYLLVAQRTQIADLASKNRLPTMSTYRQDAEAGSLVAYGPSLPEMFRRAAIYAEKILKGANPGEIPVEQPTKFELVINLKTAKALGIKIPQSIVLRADWVIE